MRYILLFPILISFASGELSGLNRGSLWVEESTCRLSFLNRLYLDYFWEDFRIGGRFKMDESLREDSLFGEFLNQRYLEYTRPRFSFRIGNFYETFGQGLILSLFEEEALNIDRNMDGAEASMNLDRFNLKVLGGRPRGEEGERDDLLYGAEANLSPLSYFQTGASYLRFDATNTPKDSSFGLPVEEWIDLMGRILIGPFQIIIDYARGYRWGEYDSSKGWIGVEGVPSYGFYLHTNFALSGFGVSLGYKDYENLNNKFNSPPPLSHSQRSLNEGKNEKGFQIETQFTPKDGLSFDIGYNNAWADGFSASLKEIYIGSELWWKGKLILFPSYNKIKSTEKREAIPHLGVVWYITPINTFEIGAECKWISESLQNYRDNRISCTYSHPGWLFGLIYENTTDPLESQANWLSGYCKIDWSNYNLELSYGSKRTHPECIGGFCYYEPTFKGAKAVFTLRF